MSVASVASVAPPFQAIDPLSSCSAGRYEDELVTVDWVMPPPPWMDSRAQRAAGPGVGGPAVDRADRIDVTRGADGRLAVEHRLQHRDLDDELGELLAALLAPFTDDHAVFARVFTGIVLSTDPYAGDAWRRFYRNTLAMIRHTPLPGYSAIYQHALDLLPTTSVLDLGCGFGFLSLHLAERGTAVTAADIDPGTTALLRRMARRLHRRVSVLDTGSRHIPLPSSSVDAVVILHVLEHIGPEEGAALITEATRVAARRVVVAVPYEDRPTRLYGHVRQLCPDDLRELGVASGWSYNVHEHLGGWLVLDRLSPGDRDHPLGRSLPPEGDLQ